MRISCYYSLNCCIAFVFVQLTIETCFADALYRHKIHCMTVLDFIFNVEKSRTSMAIFDGSPLNGMRGGEKERKVKAAAWIDKGPRVMLTTHRCMVSVVQIRLLVSVNRLQPVWRM